MPQYFPPNSNAFAKWSIVGGTIFFIIFLTVLTIYVRGYRNRVKVPVVQPVAFAHSLHAGELGIDCRFCHSSVEVSATASIPPTETCMGCHSQIRVGSPQLKVVQDSWDNDKPIAWNRVHDLADFVYFNHSAHVNKGIGCSDCHGEVDRMQDIWKNEPMSMGWCLECHRAPEKFVRPLDQVFNMQYKKPKNQLALGQELVKEYHINVDKLPQCSTCHR